MLAKEKLQQGLSRDESDEAKSKVSFTRLSDGAYLLKCKTKAGRIETYAPEAYVMRFLSCLEHSYFYVVTTGYPKKYKGPSGRLIPGRQELLKPALIKRTVILDGKTYIAEQKGPIVFDDTDDRMSFKEENLRC